MAVSSHLTRTYVKSASGAPSSSDLLSGVNASTDFNRTREEISNNHQGEAFTSLITGRQSTEVPVVLDYDPVDAKFSLVQLFETYFESGATLYITVDLAGTGDGRQVGVKVTGWNISSPESGKLTASPTLKSCTAVSTVVIS